jgi:hypothetical protein
VDDTESLLSKVEPSFLVMIVFFGASRFLVTVEEVEDVVDVVDVKDEDVTVVIGELGLPFSFSLIVVLTGCDDSGSGLVTAGVSILVLVDFFLTITLRGDTVDLVVVVVGSEAVDEVSITFVVVVGAFLFSLASISFCFFMIFNI